MKIALLIVGLPREFKTCWKNLNKFIIQPNKKHTFDIFVSTWEADRAALIKEQPKDEGSTQELLDLYQPKAYSIEKYNDQKKKDLASRACLDWFWDYVRAKKIVKRQDGRWAQHQGICQVCKHYGAGGLNKCRVCGGLLLHNGLAFFERIEKATLLMQATKIEYDIVIRTRFDNFFLDRIWPEYFENLQDREVCIPAGFDNFKEFGGGVNDQMLWAKYKDYYDSCPMVFSQFYKLAKEAVDRGWDPYPHSLLTIQLEKAGLTVRRDYIKYLLYKKKEKLGGYVEKMGEKEFRENHL